LGRVRHAPYHWEAWGDLLRTVRTGEEAFAARTKARACGSGVNATRRRAASSTGRWAPSPRSSRPAWSTYDFGRFSRVADIGGGDGTLLATGLSRHPDVRGVVFDLPHVVDGARTKLDQAGVADRCEVLAGSFFDGVPPGCDAYVLKSILHDWDDASCVRVLQQVADAAGLGATLLIVERVVADRDPPAIAVMSDLNMMVNTGGVERTMGEWRALTKSGGFDVVGQVDIGAGWSVVETTVTPTG
jgi:hypothetical protein